MSYDNASNQAKAQKTMEGRRSQDANYAGARGFASALLHPVQFKKQVEARSREFYSQPSIGRDR